jgi:hypothetical protein
MPATATSGVGLSCEALLEDDAKRRQRQADGCATFLPEVSDDERESRAAKCQGRAAERAARSAWHSIVFSMLCSTSTFQHHRNFDG